MNLKSTLRALGAAVLEEVDRNPDFAKRILNALGGTQNAISDGRGGANRKRTRAAAIVDPIAIIADQGEETLRQALQPLDLEKLLDVVAEFGMDPAKLVMKWKDPKRVIDHIVDSAKRRSAKGDAFRA